MIGINGELKLKYTIFNLKNYEAFIFFTKFTFDNSPINF
jgi:hypothetical protein